MRWINDEHTTDAIPGATLEIIAAGLHRCATSTLEDAFEHDLDLAPAMHGARLLPHLDRLKLVCQALREQDTTKRRALLHRLFDGYRSALDLHTAAFADDLMDMYPEAMIVLNQRDSAEAWQKSAVDSLRFFASWPYLITAGLVAQSYWHWQIYRAYAANVKRKYGLDDIWSTELYDKHNAYVLEQARRRGREVLVWRPEDDWEPLCAFLDKPIPAKPLPRINDKATIRELSWILVRRGLVAWAWLLGSVSVAVVAVMYGYVVMQL